MKKKLFSIIIVTFNCGELLRSSLESIVKQDDNLFECIIVDGLSQDGTTLSIIDEYSRKYRNIKYISERDNGVYDAMNKGIDLAEGRYVYFLGAGDRLCDNVLTKLSAHINDEDFIYGNVYLDYENKRVCGKLKKSDLIYYGINHQSIFYKKSVFNEVGKYEFKYKIIADDILNKRIFGDDSLKKKYVDIDVAHYLGGGISQNTSFKKEFKSEKDMNDFIVDAFNSTYLLDLYKNMQNIKNKKIIAWGTGGEYQNAIKNKKFNIDYFIQSNVDKDIFDSRPVKKKEDVLLEDKDKIIIMVFTGAYYKEIRKWLESNNLIEFEHFILVTEDSVSLLKHLKIW